MSKTWKSFRNRPGILKDQPLPRTVFIGGSGGNLLQILDHLAEHLPAVESGDDIHCSGNLTAAAYWCNSRELEPEILQADIKHAVKIDSACVLSPDPISSSVYTSEHRKTSCFITWFYHRRSNSGSGKSMVHAGLYGSVR